MAASDRRPGRKCPKGHTMDPNWKRCPYCDSEQRAKQKTKKPEFIISSAGRKTKVERAPQKFPEREKVGARETKMMPSDAAFELGGHLDKRDNRRIMGVLVTYTWRSEGQLFVIREGKNFIGSGNISSDASHRRCDAQIPQDPNMSSEHALILCRQGRFEIIDQATTNGTFLDGEMLTANQSMKLPNYAEIRTGKTIWTFIKIKAPRMSEEVKRPNDIKDSTPETKKPKTKVE